MDPRVTTGARPVALVTGVGRRAGIGFAVAERLARDDHDVAVSFWTPYDERMPWGADEGAAAELAARVAALGVGFAPIPADLEQPAAAALLFDEVETALGPVAVLVLCHCESVDSGILDTTVESFDRHVAVNARAGWLLIREFARRYRSAPGRGRVVALTSDHTVGNLPYGASKGALDRITLAAAHEFADRGITANVVNPGPTDTGWMAPDLRDRLAAETPLRRVGRPEDAARLVSFLCSPEGGWVNGQLLHSDGGLGTTGAGPVTSRRTSRRRGDVL
ncbi:MAG: SDR family oxidoreductase [Acidimicrobiales bacterium]